MPVSTVQPRLRASVFYLGSALLLAAGTVTIADQPIRPDKPWSPCGCTPQDQNNKPAHCNLGLTCTYFSICHSFACVNGTMPNDPLVKCTC
jgi:hypothetical protein